MRALPRRIRTALPPQVLVSRAVAEPVRAAVIPAGGVGDVDAAAHAGFGAGVAWLVCDASWAVLCYVGAVAVVA